MTPLEQLSLAEFSGEYARSKVYENGHKNVLDVWLNLVSNVKYSTILIFKVILYDKNWSNLFEYFFSLKNLKMGEQLLLVTYFDTFAF